GLDRVRRPRHGRDLVREIAVGRDAGGRDLRARAQPQALEDLKAGTERGAAGPPGAPPDVLSRRRARACHDRTEAWAASPPAGSDCGWASPRASRRLPGRPARTARAKAEPACSGRPFSRPSSSLWPAFLPPCGPFSPPCGSSSRASSRPCEPCGQLSSPPRPASSRPCAPCERLSFSPPSPSRVLLLDLDVFASFGQGIIGWAA